MKTKDKRNKMKLKFDYINSLLFLGKTLKECSFNINKNKMIKENNYYNEIISKMTNDQKIVFCKYVDKCDEILNYINNVDNSLIDSHKEFSCISKIIKKSSFK